MLMEKKLEDALKAYAKGKKVVVLQEFEDGSLYTCPMEEYTVLFLRWAAEPCGWIILQNINLPDTVNIIFLLIRRGFMFISGKKMIFNLKQPLLFRKKLKSLRNCIIFLKKMMQNPLQLFSKSV